MHSESSRRSPHTFTYLAPLALILVLGLIFGATRMGGSSANASLTTATLKPGLHRGSTAGPTATPAIALPILVQRKKHFGIVKGILTLPVPAKATYGSLVVHVTHGKKQVLTKKVAAPSAVKINTRKLPNGIYGVRLVWVHDGRKSVVYRGAFRIQHPRPKHPRPTPTTTPTATPTATAAPAPAPSTPAPAPTTAKPVTTSPTTAPAAPAPSGGFAQQVLVLANQARKDNGCNTPLKLNTKLNTAAQRHSDDMVKHNFFSHTGSDGTSPFDRMTQAGYQWSGAAENIAAGGTTAAGAMDQWMHSEGHRANILNCGLVDLGVGYTVGNHDDYAGYWVQDFGSPR